MSHRKHESPDRTGLYGEDYESTATNESKFWRKVKQDPVVPIGMAGFGLIVIGAIIGFNRRDRSKPTSTYWIRTRVYAQGFVVSLLTIAALFHAVKDRPEHSDSNKSTSSTLARHKSTPSSSS